MHPREGWSEDGTRRPGLSRRSFLRQSAPSNAHCAVAEIAVAHASPASRSGQISVKLSATFNATPTSETRIGVPVSPFA